DDDAEALLDKIAKRLGLPRPPRRIECFDIAHIQGSETVASMVTFVDDLAAMYEVLTRRFKRAHEATATDPWAPPDLLVIDGGKGQLAMAVAALGDLRVVMG